MKEARFSFEGEVHEAEAYDYGLESDGEVYAEMDVDLLPPTEPSKIVAVGRNYVEHAEELDNAVPEFPLFFFKPPNALVGSGGSIRYPDETSDLHYEGELGVVIGERCRDVAESEALDYVRGYTCVNDVTMRDWQERESQWARAKGGDTFCPTGPYLTRDLDPSNLDIETRLNGETVQKSNTRHMAYGVEEIIAELSRFMTLEPGDLIATGTPEGVGAMQRGDTVEVEVEGVGVLENEVV